MLAGSGRGRPGFECNRIPDMRQAFDVAAIAELVSVCFHENASSSAAVLFMQATKWL